MRTGATVGVSAIAVLALCAPLMADDHQSQSAPIKISATTENSEPDRTAAVTHAAGSLEDEMVRRNGAIFQGWAVPKLALVFTGSQDGYIEPCGCAGKENQKGGLSRRDMLLKRLADQHWPILPLDLGSQVRRYGRQAELKFQATIDALKTMGYRAVGFGPDDLRLSAAELFAIVAPVGDQASPFVSANAGLYGFDDATVPRTRVIETAGMKIGVTSVVGDEGRQKVNNQDIQFKPAAEAIQESLPKLQQTHCDLLVLLTNATLAESTALAKKFPQFQVVATTGGADEPPAEPNAIPGTKTWLLEVGHKGMYAIVLGLYDDPKQSVRYQRVPLDARFGESPRMRRVLESYQDQLKELGLSGLGLKTTRHPSGRSFVGAQTCGDCHTKAFAIWKNTPHAHALDTLAHQNPPRNFDPECLSCHVTGWEPQKFFPFAGGYTSIEKTPLLAQQGCENCHGPGSAHAAAEAGEIKVSDADLNRYRDEMRLSIKTDEARQKAINNCQQCHDADNSPQFAFDTYWPKVEHHGKD